MACSPVRRAPFLSRVSPLCAWVCLLALAGCEGSADIALSARTPAPVPAPGVEGGGDAPPPLPGPAHVACTPGTVDVAVTPLRRLTRREYDFTLRDVLGEPTSPASSFIADEKVASFDSNAIAPLTPLQLSDHVAAAETVAASALTRLGSGGLSCDWSAESCVFPWLTQLSTRLYRRPAPAEAMSRLRALYVSAKASWGATEAVRLCLEAMLTSPYFLYHHEPAFAVDAQDGAVVPLDGYATAARLSYFLWQSAPDDALLEAAASGVLSTPEAVEAQARRMLTDPRAAHSLDGFFAQWLGVDALEERTKASSVLPGWDAALGTALRAQTLALVRGVFASGGAKLETLLTTSEGYVDSATAPLYGVAAPSGAGMTKVVLPPDRQGLLTQPSFLAAHAHAAEPSWVLRGRFVREQLLCGVIPPPPPDVAMDTNNDPNRLSNPSCAGCHLLMDPIGQGFDEYDAVGRRVATTPAQGEVHSAGAELDGPFLGVGALSTRLSQSESVQGCMSRQYLRFALGREETAADACTLEAARAALQGSDGDLRELLVALARSDAFRFRRVVR